MSGLWQDFRYAARGLGKNPGIAAIMVFTLALAIGVRVALGATSGDVLRMVLGQGIRTILIGGGLESLDRLR